LLQRMRNRFPGIASKLEQAKTRSEEWMAKVSSR
jgi:hypothetical protein